MAGYIMNMNDIEAVKKCIEEGVYSTILGRPKKEKWGRAQEGTFADYFSMKPGDHIYFFCKRKIYGIGEIVEINADCKYLNYVDADEPIDYSEKEYYERKPLLSLGSVNNRCFCTFKPKPCFFEQGVDMDDALNSNPAKFRMLRAMWKVSFIKVDEEEDKALRDIILKRNEEELYSREKIFEYFPEKHEYIKHNVSSNYRMSAYKLLASCKHEENSKIKHEMAIEAALCELLSKKSDTLFGHWDYISHQVIASPFKAIDYMDKMDIFGYRYIKGYDTISKYMVIEIKKDAAQRDVIDQIMKYVDWIQSEYTHGDYSMIEAYVVAEDFSKEIIEYKNERCVRYFTKGFRLSIPCIWRNIKLIQYEYKNQELVYKEI